MLCLQLFNDYGAHGDVEWLLNYGFVPTPAPAACEASPPAPTPDRLPPPRSAAEEAAAAAAASSASHSCHGVFRPGARLGDAVADDGLDPVAMRAELDRITTAISRLRRARLPAEQASQPGAAVGRSPTSGHEGAVRLLLLAKATLAPSIERALARRGATPGTLPSLAMGS